MSEKRDGKTLPARAGLCEDCTYARQVKSSHDSVFLLCELSRTDPHFAKYPRLPVLSCEGYEKKAAHG